MLITFISMYFSDEMPYVGGSHAHDLAWLFIHMPNNEEPFEA